MTRVPFENLSYPGDGLHYYQQKPFTGVAVYSTPEGWDQAEEEYRNGLLWGWKREWYRPGFLEREAECAWGARHGIVREWHEDGQLAAEANYEYGVRVSGKRWDTDGKLVEEFRLQETDPAFQVLQAARAAYGHADENI